MVINAPVKIIQQIVYIVTIKSQNILATKRNFKILANKEQLENIGVDYNLEGLVGELTYKYPTGWYRLKVTHCIGNYEFTNEFDFPKTFLKEVK